MKTTVKRTLIACKRARKKTHMQIFYFSSPIVKVTIFTIVSFFGLILDMVMKISNNKKNKLESSKTFSMNVSLPMEEALLNPVLT